MCGDLEFIAGLILVGILCYCGGLAIGELKWKGIPAYRPSGNPCNKPYK